MSGTSHTTGGRKKKKKKKQIENEKAKLKQREEELARARYQPRCAYCHFIWDDKSFNINKPSSGRVHRFKAATIAEMPDDVAGTRLCASCLRCKRLCSEDTYITEQISLFLLKVLVWAPCSVFVTATAPLRKLYARVVRMLLSIGRTEIKLEPKKVRRTCFAVAFACSFSALRLRKAVVLGVV